MEMLWRIAETVGMVVFVVGMLATAIIHTIGYIRFQLAQLKAEGKTVSGTKK